VNWSSIYIVVIGTIIGWGFVTNTFASWLNWQGYFLGVLGGKDGAWAYANVGVMLAMLVGVIGRLIFGRNQISKQEN
jgi:hypothetical protein